MWKSGSYSPFSAIFLLIGITFIPNILAFENYNFQHQKYDYVDVAKEAPRARSKGQTTRIFTTDNGLDEKFWLKYLGEDIRNAVHLQLDDSNNVIPVKEDIKRQHYPTLNYDAREEQHGRFVRQSLQDFNKQEPVEILNKQNVYQYPTEEPDAFNIKPATTPLPLQPPQARRYTQIDVNSKRPAQHMDKQPINSVHKMRTNHLNSPRTFKAIHEPIVVNLPETANSEHQINDERDPLVVQIPPIIYHRKAEFYPEHLQE